MSVTFILFSLLISSPFLTLTNTFTQSHTHTRCNSWLFSPFLIKWRVKVECKNNSKHNSGCSNIFTQLVQQMHLTRRLKWTVCMANRQYSREKKEEKRVWEEKSAGINVRFTQNTYFSVSLCMKVPFIVSEMGRKGLLKKNPFILDSISKNNRGGGGGGWRKEKSQWKPLNLTRLMIQAT